MKYPVIVFLSVLSVGSVYGQKDTTIYFNGVIDAKGQVKDGKPVGEWTYFRKDGNINAQLTYLDDGRIKKGKKIYADTVGLVQWECLLSKSDAQYTLKPGEITVYEFEHYSNGSYTNAQEQFEFEDNYQTGEWKMYYRNGKISNLKHFKNGYLDGEWKQYYENGNIMAEGNFEGNAKTGEWKTYYSNGKPRSKGNYFPDVIIYRQSKDSYDKIKIIGKENKLVKEDNSKNLKNELDPDNAGSYDLPKVKYFKDGTWQYWNENNKLIKEETWNKGELLETREY